MDITPGKIIGAGAIAALALTGACSVTRVKPTEKAVQVIFQQVKAVLGPGWHITPPFVTTAHYVPLTLRIAELGKLNLRTKDQQNYDLNVTAHYCVTDGCTDPDKLGDVRDQDVLQVYLALGGRDPEDVIKNYVRQAASVVAGQEGLLNVAKDLTRLRQEIIAHTRNSIQEAGYSRFLRIQDVIVDRFKMDPAAEAFANKIATESQNTTLLELQRGNAVIAVSVAELQAKAQAALTAGYAKGTADGIRDIMDKTGASPDAAINAMNVNAALLKWDGHSLTAPVSPGLANNIIVDIGKRPPVARKEDNKGLVPQPK